MNIKSIDGVLKHHDRKALKCRNRWLLTKNPRKAAAHLKQTFRWYEASHRIVIKIFENKIQ